MLYSLGLRWRVELLHEMAVDIVTQHSGHLPQSKQDLMSLPGVSHYIASAVLCFAQNEPEAIVDTNTVRVIARLFDIKVTDGTRRNRAFHELASALVDPADPRDYNFAMLDLADAICTPAKPLHADCPLLPFCRTGLQVLSSESA